MVGRTIGREMDRVFQQGTIVGLSEGQLLKRFLAERDEAAFEALVVRHGPMVLGVCRRMLGDPHDAADAFQATFLLLVRKAETLRDPDQLGPWLHGVAFKVSARARSDSARRVSHERNDRRGERWEAAASLDHSELRGVLDEELHRLPEKYRRPIILCYMDGMSQEEAARRLRCTTGSLRGRLDRGRERLRSRLIRRGMAPATALAATEFARGSIVAAIPDALKESATLNALCGASARAAAAGTPAAVLSLAEEVGRLPLFPAVKLAAFVLGCGVVLSAAPRLLDGPGAKTPLEPPRRAGRRPAPAPGASQPSEKKAMTTLRVVDPDGKPAVGAKVFASSTRRGLDHSPVAPKPLGETGPDGTLMVPREDGGEKSVVPQLFARVEGFGPAFVEPSGEGEVRIARLVRDDVPIQGRVLDIQGRPVAGATIGVAGIIWHPSLGLDPWLAALEKEKAAYSVQYDVMRDWSSDDVPFLFPPVVADEQGRFTIRGIGRERIVSLLVSGPGIATTFEYAATRSMPKQTYPDFPRQNHGRDVTYYGTNFDLVVGPGLTAVGRITDKDDGRPLGGVKVGTSALFGNPMRTVWTTTDPDGRYRLVGIPPRTDFNDDQDLLIESKADPYLPAIRRLAAADGSKPIVMDFAIKRGVRARGRIVDKLSGKGVRAQLSYYILADNLHRKEYPKYGTVRAGMPNSTDDDGNFDLVVMPGPGVLGARAGNERYRLGSGIETIPNLKWTSERHEMIDTLPHHLIPQNYHTVLGIDPKPGDESLNCEIALDFGRTVKGRVIGPDGQPLIGARIEGLQDYFRVWSHKPLESPDFVVEGIGQGASRDLLAIHEEKKLSGAFVIGPEEAGPITLKLGPGGCMTGRLVDVGGLPLTGVDLSCYGSQDDGKNERGSLPDGLKTDDAGRFRAEGLIPGRKYHLRAWIKGPEGRMNQLRDLIKDVEAGPGEVKDLGDLTLKASE